jgi:hypothetical protein
MLIPLLGFIFLPLTTIVYAYMMNSHIVASGGNLIWLILAALVDLGAFGGLHRSRDW